jgi:hypothetical protein
MLSNREPRATSGCPERSARYEPVRPRPWSLVRHGGAVAGSAFPDGRRAPGRSAGPAAFPQSSGAVRAADKTVPPAAQDEMVAGVGGVAADATLDCGHMAMLADPGGLAAAILRLSA